MCQHNINFSKIKSINQNCKKKLKLQFKLYFKKICEIFLQKINIKI